MNAQPTVGALSRAIARLRDGDRRDFVVLYGGGVRRTLTGALTLTNRQPGGRSGDRAAGLRPLIPRGATGLKTTSAGAIVGVVF